MPVAGGDFWTGFTLVLCGSLGESLGTGLQQLVLQSQDHALPPALRRSQYLTREWIGGMFLILAGAVMKVLSLAFLPISIAVPLMSMDLVVATLFSQKYLRKKLPQFRLGVVLTLTGFLGASLSAQFVSDPELSEETLEADFFHTGSKLYVLALTFFAIGFAAIYPYSHKKPLICAVVAACICALRFIGIKGIVELLKYSVEKEETQFAARDTFGWVLLVFVLLLMGVHSYLQHKGILQSVYSTSTLVLSVVAGIIVFNEWENTRTSNIMLQVIFLTLCFAGQYLLTREFPFDHVSYRFVPISTTYPAELELTADMSAEESDDFGGPSTRGANGGGGLASSSNASAARNGHSTERTNENSENSHRASNRKNGSSRKKQRRRKSNSHAKRGPSSWQSRHGDAFEEDSTLLLGNGGSDYSDIGDSDFGNLLDADDFDEVLHGIGDVSGLDLDEHLALDANARYGADLPEHLQEYQANHPDLEIDVQDSAAIDRSPSPSRNDIDIPSAFS